VISRLPIVISVTQFSAKMSNLSRRDFLKLTTASLLAVSGLLGLDGLLRFLNYQTEPSPKTEFDLGPAAKYPLGSQTLLADVPAVLIHDASGFSALSLVCTHLGCTVEQTPAGFTCPCHGSRYDEKGRVQRGPAKEPLPQLRIETTPDDHLILYADQI
jgi:cytochrome b6-f complex iron-sulfur subunit